MPVLQAYQLLMGNAASQRSQPIGKPMEVAWPACAMWKGLAPHPATDGSVHRVRHDKTNTPRGERLILAHALAVDDHTRGGGVHRVAGRRLSRSPSKTCGVALRHTIPTHRCSDSDTSCKEFSRVVRPVHDATFAAHAFLRCKQSLR